MASRSTNKQEARERARLIRQAQARRERRARRLTIVSVIAAVVLVIGGVGGIVAMRVSAHHTTTGGGSAQAGALPGLQTSAAPWQPEYPGLPARLAALHLPPNGDESFHIHAHLAVFVDGKQVPVPANSGISQAAQLESPMHTHDTSGVIHIEASQPSNAFTLGAFLTIWGVKFTPTQIGGYTNTGNQTVQTYVNGTLVTDGPAHPLADHDDIVIGYGTPGSSPHTQPFNWAQAGL